VGLPGLPLIAPALPLILPLLVAAILVGVAGRLGRRVVDMVSILTASTVTLLCALLLAQSAHAPLVYWFGGWRPSHGIALGVAFVVDPFGAGLATLAGVLVTASFVSAWHYFAEVKSIFHVLLLVMLAAMVGFCLTGDLFNMFVFFELMSVAAFALTGYLVEENGPVQGAISYTVTASVGAFLFLSGIGLLYGRTGALNLAQIGRALVGRPPDGLVITAFVLVAVGLLVKAGVVPFHFWLPDVETVAPTPVCVIFSGAIVTMGLYGLARVYWTVFAAPLGAHGAALRPALVAVGVVTALLGAVMCPLQHHLKRLLAFSTLAHMGMALIGVALLTPLGLAGTAVYLAAHGLIKGALFLGVGVLAHRFGHFDERHLRGQGRALPVLGLLFAVGGLGLAGFPPLGTYLAKGMIEDAGATASVGMPWLTAVLVATSICTGGAVLRVTGCIFLGWGPAGDDETAATEGRDTEAESTASRARTPVVMLAPIAALLLAALALGLLPHLGAGAEAAAARFQDQAAYAAASLDGVGARAARMSLEPADPTAGTLLSGVESSGGAVIFALLILERRRLPVAPRRIATRFAARPHALLTALQSGHVGDYVAWLTVGVAALGGLCAAALR